MVCWTELPAKKCQLPPIWSCVGFWLSDETGAGQGGSKFCVELIPGKVNNFWEQAP